MTKSTPSTPHSTAFFASSMLALTWVKTLAYVESISDTSLTTLASEERGRHGPSGRAGKSSCSPRMTEEMRLGMLLRCSRRRSYPGHEHCTISMWPIGSGALRSLEAYISSLVSVSKKAFANYNRSGRVTERERSLASGGDSARLLRRGKKLTCSPSLSVLSMILNLFTLEM